MFNTSWPLIELCMDTKDKESPIEKAQFSFAEALVR